MSHTQKDKPVEEIDLQYTSILHLRAPLSLSVITGAIKGPLKDC